MEQNPLNIPVRTLHTGARMPGIALGTFGSDRYAADDIANAVREAIRMGYRSIDCAACYGNQTEIGKALRDALSEVPREQLFITSKLWNDRHGYDRAMDACHQTLDELGLDYLDMYLIHWPFANYHPPGAPEDYHNPNAKPYDHRQYMDTWRALEALVDGGQLRHIGTSNLSIAKLQLLLAEARIPPAVNQMELHPTFRQQALFDYCRANGIGPVGFCPLGSPGRPERDRTAQDIEDMRHPVIVEIATRLGIAPAEVLISWAVSRGQVPVAFSVKKEQLRGNLKAAARTLDEQDMRKIEAIDCDNRLIKGQVFLWRQGQDWRDLWDEDGVIAR